MSLSLFAQVAEKLVGMGVNGELSQLVAGCLWVRREEIRAQLLKDSYKFSHTYLNDFDWRLKVCVCISIQYNRVHMYMAFFKFLGVSTVFSVCIVNLGTAYSQTLFAKHTMS